MLVIGPLLTAADLAAVQEMAVSLPFGDGRTTAGRHAVGVKANDQALPSAELDAVLEKVEAALIANPLFQSAARPKALTKLILSRYCTGQTYGLHVDNALMQGLRTDLSFTLFLSDPDTYEGGALVIRKPASPARTGWAQAAKAVALAKDDEPLLGDFANEGDEDLVW